MPKLGGELIDLYFRQHYKRGAILRFYMECDDPEVDFKYKFGILLNLNTTESDALLGITTSNLKPFASGFLENDIVRISGGKYPCFPRDTIINLREVRIEPVTKLRSLCEQKADDLRRRPRRIRHDRGRCKTCCLPSDRKALEETHRPLNVNQLPTVQPASATIQPSISTIHCKSLS